MELSGPADAEAPVPPRPWVPGQSEFWLTAAAAVLTSRSMSLKVNSSYSSMAYPR
jgi:hypothetical protein